MSIIKSDDKNTNWQFNVLKGLQSLSNLLTTLSNKINPIVPIEITPVIRVEENTPSLLNEAVKSITFASIGTGPAGISFDGGATFYELKNGSVVNMDAGGVNNFYAAGKFSWNTSFGTYPGAKLMITYNK
jgi:hypothetical protein